MNGSTPSSRWKKLNALEFELMRGKVVTCGTFASNVDGVFAVGDYVTGPATIIEAAGLGRRAARAVDRWLSGVRGEELAELPVINRATITQALDHDMPRFYEAYPRQHIPAPPEMRRDFTGLVEIGYDTRVPSPRARCPVQPQHQHRRTPLYPVRALRLPRGRDLHGRQGAGR